MTLDWDRPVASPSGDRYIVRAVVRKAKNGAPEVLETTDRAFSTDEKQRVLMRWDEGVRFVCTKDRGGGGLVFYKADGTPWIEHHPTLKQVNGAPYPIDRKIAETAKRNAERKARADQFRKEAQAGRRAAEETAEAEHLAIIQPQIDAMEANPMWATF